jgi:Cu-processing system permease protein
LQGALFRRAPRAVHLFASEELVLALRSRWTQIFTVVFGVLAVAVAGAGYVLSGGHGVQDFARTAVSLVQLVLLLVPLTALVIGVLSLAPERGAAELVFSQPVSRATILFGKLLGLFQALGAAQAVGFGVAGMLVYAQSGSEGLSGFALLVGASLVTTAVFLGLAALLAAGSVGRKRTRALALALVVWFVAVVFFDLAALGVASLLPSGTASRVLMVAAIVNPLSAVRTGALLGIEGTGAFGAASLALFRFTGGPSGTALVR